MSLPNDPQRHPGRPRFPGTNTGCVNNATNRQCWGNGFNIDTNMETTWPNTRQVKRYTLEIQNTTLRPDGTPRVVYAVNGQFPGPTIRCNWGDTLQITVRNKLQVNGTSIHWHGIRQWQSNPMDGTNGITECPLAPNQERTYTFLATQYGTTWYHSHHSSQYGDGTWGTIVIDGPTSANYDEDLGVMPVQDWFYQTTDQIMSRLSAGQIRGQPVGNNILINGTNVNAQGDGKYHNNTIEKGKCYKLRLVNTGIGDTYQVGLDGHNMTVVAMDFVPIVPYNTTWLTMGIGQRYDVVICANQPMNSYWFHVVPQASCSSNSVANAVSIFTYKGSNSTIPTTGRDNAPPSNSCVDDNVDLIPWVPLNVPSNEVIPQTSHLDVGFAVIQNSTSGTAVQVQWTLNGTAIYADWANPTLEYVKNGSTSYPKTMNLISLPDRNQWSFWVIQATNVTAPPQAHPMHLHGHDFYVLGAGTGVYDNSQTLNYINPPRRDVAMLPPLGYLVLAFKTDNPGAWLMHCHVAWHQGLGFGAQFLETAQSAQRLVNQTPAFQQQCNSWDSYDNGALYPEEGSGI